MKFTIGTVNDIDGVLKLQYKYHIDSIREDDKKDGFVTTAFTRQDLKLLIEEKGLFLVKNNNIVIAYAMSASWDFWSKWPMFTYMIKDLKNLKYLGQVLNTKNSYQYGPICIDKLVRGTNILSKLFDFSREHMSKKYPILVTFINEINTRSYEAHVRKLGLQVIKEFKFNDNKYYTMVYDTTKAITQKEN